MAVVDGTRLANWYAQGKALQLANQDTKMQYFSWRQMSECKDFFLFLKLYNVLFVPFHSHSSPIPD